MNVLITMCSLFNTLWLIANDISIGYSVSSLLRSHSSSFSKLFINNLEVYAVEMPTRLLQWTNSYPVGLKLNDELGRAFCDSSAKAIELWWRRESLPRTTNLTSAELSGQMLSCPCRPTCHPSSGPSAWHPRSARPLLSRLQPISWLFRLYIFGWSIEP